MTPITIARTVAATTKVVWEAWTDPRAFSQWMGPAGWDITDCSIDLRPGGHWSTTQRSPDGTLHPTGGRYLVVDPPRHLGFNWILTAPDGTVVVEAEHHLRLRPLGRGTELSLEIRILTTGSGSEAFVAGVQTGWIGTLGKLTTFLGGSPR